MGLRRSCCFVSTSARQLRPCEKWVENQRDIPLALLGLCNGLVPQWKLVMCKTFGFVI